MGNEETYPVGRSIRESREGTAGGDGVAEEPDLGLTGGTLVPKNVELEGELGGCRLD